MFTICDIPHDMVKYSASHIFSYLFFCYGSSYGLKHWFMKLVDTKLPFISNLNSTLLR